MPRPLGQPKESHGKDWVALILAIALGCAVNTITFAVLWDAIFGQQPGLSENATQILVSVFGGIIGVLGGYLGYRAGERNERTRPDRWDGSAGAGGREPGPGEPPQSGG